METLTLQAKTRDIIGKKVRHLRKQGLLPAVMYGHGIKPKPLALNYSGFEKIFETAGSSTLVNLKIDDQKPVKILIHEPDKNPVTDKDIHVDLYQVKMTEKIKTEIPLKFIGEPPAVKELEGNLITNKDAIEIECLPDELISEIEVDISSLKTLEDLIHVKDLKIPSGIEVLDEPEEIICQVTPPRSEEELKEMEKEVTAEAEKKAVEKIEAEAEAEKAKAEGEVGKVAPAPETPAPEKPSAGPEQPDKSPQK